MIRRDARAEDGTPAWILVDQVEHARVSGDLAQSWGATGFAPPDPHHTVVSAIYRHDDGWPDYDRTPDTDPVSGRPCEFTEMQMHTANTIWSASIEKVADLGPLAQYMVASHFVTLRCDGQRADSPEAVEFIRTFRGRCQQWLAQWQQADPAHTPERARTALAHLQLFDALSLWLCCAARNEPAAFSDPLGTAVQFDPLSDDRILVQPWPWLVDRLQIAVPGRQVPARFYRDPAQLAAAPSSTVLLSWQLIPL